MFRILFLIVLLIPINAGCELPESGTDTSPDASSENTAPSANSSTSDSNPAAATAARILAVCTLEPIGDSGVSGTVRFTQQGGIVQIRGEVQGLEPGEYGFHIHETGDLSDKKTGKSAGGHFNPTNKPHGKPGDTEQHVGDLGNIMADENGTAKVEIDDKVVRLDGEHSIGGLALLIHTGADKFTQPTGDAGDRVAFGEVKLSK